MQIKVLSWNIWVDGRFDLIKRFLESADADVIGLQEVQDNDAERDVINYLSQLGYQHVFAMTEHSWGGKNYRIGPALFSKLPIIDRGTFLINEEDKRAVAWADVQVNDKKLHFFSVHLIHTHQKQSDQQEAETARLIEKLSSTSTVVMGDFNATPESNTVRAMREVLVDVDPEELPTWSMYKEGCEKCKLNQINTKLDYIFVSDDLEYDSFEVERSDGSDHLPISVEIKI